MSDRRVATPARTRTSPETATQRLGRLLDLVPWLLRNPGVSIEAAATEFGVTPAQVESDLELLFVCGTPGYTHSELIDAQWDDGHIYLANADDIAAPMRLTRDEAVTLTAGLQALGSTLVNSDVVERTLDKLRQATTAAEPGGGQIALDLDDGSQHSVMTELKEALSARRRVHLTYYVATRDESTERDVDIMRIVNLDGQWYLEGWCHRAGAVRFFRVDRILAARVLDQDGTPPEGATPRDLDDDQVFVPSDSDLTVVLEATPEGAWIADYYPNEGVRRNADGSLRVTLKVADPALVRRLVLRLGGAVRVVSPPELVDAVAHEARAALAAYETVT